MKRLRLLSAAVLFSLALQAQPGIITTICGNGIPAYNGDGGLAVNAQVFSPHRVRMDNAGNLYFLMQTHNVVRKISAAGVITTVAGTGLSGYSGDGGPATAAMLFYPADIALDTAGNLYIADRDNFRIRKVDAATGIITTICGTGSPANTGDSGPALGASIAPPKSVAVDRAGNVYIGADNRVRRIDPFGTINTFCGNGTGGGVTGFGGPAWQGTVVTPYSICADTAGNVFVASDGWLIRIANDGIMHHVSGAGGGGYSGDGGPAVDAEITTRDVTIDKEGRLFLADMTNHIRMIDIDGIITTVAGDSTMFMPGYSGDGGDAMQARLGNPEGIAVDTCGNLYISDRGNSRIRKVTYVECAPLGVASMHVKANTISVYPNPVTSSLTVASDNMIRSVRIYDVTGREVLRSSETIIDVCSLVSGVYFVRVRDVSGGSRVEKIIKE